MVAVVCQACAGTFNRTPGKLANGEGKYCSSKCRSDLAGYRGQVRAALPGTIADIAARSGVSIETVRDQLVALQKRGEAHPAWLDVVPADNRGRGTPAFAAVYEAGPGSDPDMPLLPRAVLAHLYRKRILEQMPGTQTQLRERTGLSVGNISRVTAELHSAGKIHITRWRRGVRGGPVPVYAAGAGTDRKCAIENYTRAEVCARYIKRHAKRGTLEQYRARMAANQRAVTLRKQGDPLVNALFGRVTAKEAA